MKTETKIGTHAGSKRNGRTMRSGRSARSCESHVSTRTAFVAIAASMAFMALMAGGNVMHADDAGSGDGKPILANPHRAGRSMTMSQHGIVASSHVLASQAGLDILRAGGSAMDAAIATAATLGVVEPAMVGLGGDVFILYYEAATGKVHALNGSGRSPMALTRDYFAAKDKEEIDGGSWEAVTVPGAADAYTTAHDRFGKLTFAEVLAPAIRYADEGFVVHEVVGKVWNLYGSGPFGPGLTVDPYAREYYLTEEGKPPAVGTVWKFPRLAETLRVFAEGGRDAFYEGPIAEEIVRHAQATGGWLTMEDFAAHHSEWIDPISVNYRGYDVYQCPPNGQGMAVLMILNILEGYDLKSMRLNSPEYLHLLIEATKLAYADLHKFLADPDTYDPPIDWLLSKEYAAERRKLIDPERAAKAVEPGIPTDGDTIYCTAIDSEGNAASFINSLYSAFGSKIVGGETGVMLQNRGGGFALTPGRDHFNEYAPGKRPYHTIIPGMVLKDDALYLSYGLMGGSMQPQGHVQFLLGHIEHGLTLQEAMDMPRWRHLSGVRVSFEEGTPEATIAAMAALGHRTSVAGGLIFGGAQAIAVDPATGVYRGASDPRKDGAALGY